MIFFNKMWRNSSKKIRNLKFTNDLELKHYLEINNRRNVKSTKDLELNRSIEIDKRNFK